MNLIELLTLIILVFMFGELYDAHQKLNELEKFIVGEEK